jgi:hypothetical protein
MFLLAGLCFLFVGIANYDGRSLTFYANCTTGILFIIVAIRNYRSKGTVS